MTSQLKTFMLLALLSGLIIVLGGALGGKTGIVIAFGLALIMNVGSYWYSDKIVLRMYQARELSESEAPMIYSMVRELAANAQIPMPRIAVVPEEAPNAFATGRNPENSVVAVTEGILRLLSPEELKGVLAHEIAHIANRDILIQTVAGVMASTIVSIANFMQFAAIFGMGRSSEDGEGGGSNPLMAIVLAILAPIAASLIQFAISRSREYLADASGARYCGQPLALAAALGKLQSWNQRIPMQNGNPTTAEMFIVAPLFGGGMAKLFSTHPDINDRIARLREMAGIAPSPAWGKTLWTAPERLVHSPEFTAPPPFTVHFLHVSKEDGFRIRRKPDAEPFLLIPEQSDTPLATNRKEYVSFLRSNGY